MRLLLLYEAAYNPVDEWFVTSDDARKRLSASPNTVATARGELANHGFIVLERAGVRPGQAGGQSRKGRAALYRLPHREEGSQRTEWGWWQLGHPAPFGCWRIHSKALRHLISNVTDPEAKLLLWFHCGKRTAEGSLMQNEPRKLDWSEIGISEATGRRATEALVKKRCKFASNSDPLRGGFRVQK